jgi:hypothetical protein
MRGAVRGEADFAKLYSHRASFAANLPGPSVGLVS